MVIVMLIRGKKEPAVWRDRTRARALQRAKALAELHSTDYEETDEGFVVDASVPAAVTEDLCRQGQPGGPIAHWRIPGCHQPQHPCKRPAKKRKKNPRKNPDTKAILRRAMRGT